MSEQEKDRPSRNRTPFDRQDGERRPKPLRQSVAEIDQEILRLLLRRHNMLEKMRRKGRMASADEKFLRESWQNAVARVSRDSALSGRFFSLLQEVSFLPRPEAPAAAGEENIPGAQRRTAFNLAPSKSPVKISLPVPPACRQTRAWLYLAAAAGMPLRLEPCLGNDPIVDCVKALDQMGAAINRAGGVVEVRQFQPMGRPDKVIHTGGDEFNFYLFVAHYLGAHSRVKFTGDTALKLADFSVLRHALPALGARLVHIVPKSNGLPCRLECSGILPETFAFASDLPASFAEALLLAAPFYEQPLALDLALHPRKAEILDRVLPILEACAASFSLDGHVISMKPAGLSIPRNPALPLEPDLGAFLLALAAPLAGSVKLAGTWPAWPEWQAVLDILVSTGMAPLKTDSGLGLTMDKPLADFNPAGKACAAVEKLSPGQFPLLAALAACALLNGGKASLPENILRDGETADFLRACGIETDESGAALRVSGADTPIWNAPSPQWAMALALAACARQRKEGLRLGNPGIMTELWPGFWALYNSLPAPKLKDEIATAQVEPKSRRRILTAVVAEPPEIREEDWER